MARGYYKQSSFLGGEWSPFFQGKSDEAEYYTGVTLSLNYIPVDEGALVRRSGSRFCAHAKSDTSNIALIEFISETQDALICELTEDAMRFHTRGTLLTDGTDPELLSISTATPAVVETITAHGWTSGDTVIFVDRNAVATVPVRNWQFTITVTSSTTFTLQHTGPLGTSDVDGSTLNALTAISDLAVYRVTERTTLPYTAAQVQDVKFTEEEDRLFLFHSSHEVNTIDRVNLVVTEQEFLDGPYLDENTESTTLGFSAVTGSITVTASSTTGINNGDGFQSTDVGRAIRVNSGTTDEPNWTWLEITAVASTTSITATVRGEDLAATTAVTTWRLGAFSDTTGWPTHGVIHEGRLFVVSDAQSGRVYASKTFEFFNFEPTSQDGTVADDNSITAVFAGAGRQNGRWLQVQRNGLLIGTDGGEYIVRASSFDDPLTPFTVQVRRHTAYGASAVQPIRAGRNTLFVQELGRGLMEYKELPNGEYDGTDIARQARHLTTDGIIDLAYSKVPTPIAWALRGDNRLIGVTYRDDVEGRQVAWHRHSVEYEADETAGEDGEDRYLRGGGSRSTGSVYSIANAPFSDPEASRNDNLWMAVDRDGTVCIEYITPMFDASFTPNEAFFVDSGSGFFFGDRGVSYEVISDNGTDATIRLYGLDRLEGKTIDTTYRGFDAGTATVANGYVDVTVESGLDTAAAAYEVESGIFQYEASGLTFSPNVISEQVQTSPTTNGVPCPQSTIITGEDGNDYYISGGSSGAGGSPDTLIIRDASDGSIAITLTGAQAVIDADAIGVTPPSGGLTSTMNLAAVTIPETPYILVIGGSASGVSTDKRVLYYRINSGGTLTLDGGYAGRTGGLDVQGSPPGAAGDAYVAAGLIISGSPLSAPSRTTIPYLYPIGVAYYGESRSTVMVVPSINYAIANSPMLESGADHWANRELALSNAGFGANIFAVEDGALGTANKSRGFFLPRGAGAFGSNFFQMFSTADLEAHDAGTETTTNTFLDANAGTYTDGLVSSTQISTTVDAGAFGFISNFGISSTSYNAQIVADDGLTSAFPFSDDGEDSGGSAGNADENYYGNPTVYPSDTTDPTKPWFLFFPRFYRSSGDEDNFGVRVMEYNPQTRKIRNLQFATGSLYTLGTDVDADTNPFAASLTWDRSTGTITALLRSDATGEDSFIVAEFGTFSPTPADSSQFVAASHTDAVVGCTYRSRAQLLRPDVGAGARNDAHALGKTRRADQYAMLTYRTGPMDIGSDFDTMFAVCFENLDGADVYSRDPLFSQVAHGSLQSSYDFDNLMAWEQSRPLPGTVVTVAAFISAQDR